MLKRLKKLFSKDSEIKQDDLLKIKSLHDPQRTSELQLILYESAFQNAANFVHDELKRHESPFKDLQREIFFNEILIVNFWMIEKVFRKYLENVSEKMHRHYFGSLPDINERTVALTHKIKSYNLCWDDYTGHHDEFGLRVGEALFGKEARYPEKSVSFWIISYADDSIKKYKRVRKQCREAGLIHKGDDDGKIQA